MCSRRSCSSVFLQSWLWLPLLVLFILVSSLSAKETALNSTGHAVTYSNIHGRLGDALLAYMRAKWISYIYGIPLLYQPFNYSTQLVMDTAELSYEKYVGQFAREILVDSLQEIRVMSATKSRPTLFQIPYFSESIVEHRDFAYFNPALWFQVDWEDPDFRKLLREQIAPKEILALISPPKDAFSVAIHLRLGTGFDPECAKNLWPLKFPPLSWYRDQLRYVSGLCGDYPIHVHIFTDDPKPSILTEYFKKTVDNPRMTFSYREEENNHNLNVLEDLFSMANFECIIRPMSNFSLVAGIIGDAKLIIYPTSYLKKRSSYTIDGTHITSRIPLRLHQRE